MTRTELIEQFIYPLLKDHFEESGDTPPPQYHPQMALFGSDGIFDSMALVSFVLEIEDAIKRKTGKTLRLVSDKALSRKNSPFKSVEFLADYVFELMEEAP